MALSGMMCALATPMSEAGRIDFDGLDHLLTRVLEGGVTGVCPVGSTGEGPRLTREQRARVVRHVRERVPEEIQVIPAPAALNATEALAELSDFAALGADASLLAPPAYYPMADTEVLHYYEGIAAKTEIPLLLYNIPAVTKVRIAPRVAGELARHPNIIGLKDSSRDLEYFQATLYATARSEFRLFTGSDTLLLASLLLGGSGAIAASANLVPELGVALYDAVKHERWAKARELQRRLYEIVSACRIGSLGVGWKAALELAGVCSACPVAPATSLELAGKADLAGKLRSLGVLSDDRA